MEERRKEEKRKGEQRDTTAGNAGWCRILGMLSNSSCMNTAASFRDMQQGDTDRKSENIGRACRASPGWRAGL